MFICKDYENREFQMYKVHEKNCLFKCLNKRTAPNWWKPEQQRKLEIFDAHIYCTPCVINYSSQQTYLNRTL